MLRRITTALLALLICVPAQAQQPEQATIQFAIPPLWCNGVKQDGGMIFLENYVNRPLPSPIYILGSWIWVDGTNVSQTLGGITGNVPLAVDPQQQYAKDTGWPFGNGSPIYQPLYYKLFAYRRLEEASNTIYYPLQYPVRYSAGDGVAVSPECTGGNGTNPLWVFVILNIISPVPGGDLQDLPLPSGFFEKKTPLTNASNAGTGVSARSVFPGPAQTTTKFRARIYQKNGASSAQVQHMSVCLQAGNTSSCQSPPVQLKFGSQDGYYLTAADAVWSNIIDFTVPAGQNILVTTSTFLPGSTNYWSYSSSGNGMWVSSTDAWNTVAMSNATFYANFTQSVDWVQMW